MLGALCIDAVGSNQSCMNDATLIGSFNHPIGEGLDHQYDPSDDHLDHRDEYDYDPHDTESFLLQQLVPTA